MGFVAGRFGREAGTGRESQQPLIHSLFLSVGVQLERKEGEDDVCADFVFWNFLEKAQHRVIQRVERDVQARGK